MDDDNRRLLYNKVGKCLPTKSYNNEPKNSAFKINRAEKEHNFATAYQFQNSESNTRTNDETKKILDKTPESLDPELQKNEQPLEGNDVYLTQYHHDLQTTKRLLYEARMQIEEQNQKIQELTIKNLNFNANKIVTELYTLDYKDQELPLICKFYYKTESFVITFDEQKLEQLKRY